MTTILFILLGIILLLTYGVLFLAYRLSKQQKVLNTPQENYGQSLEIIEQAQKQGNAIVEKAVESAKHILFETEYVKQDIAREMQDSLQKVAEETVKMVQGSSTESEKEFRTVVNEIKQEFEKVAEQKLSAIQKVAEDETNDFKEILRRETIDSQLFIGKKIGDDFKTVQDELTVYKKAKMSEIDKNIKEITKQVVEETLGQSITLPIHEDLVMASLENAKKTGIFRQLEQFPKPAAEATPTPLTEPKEKEEEKKEAPVE